MIRITPTHDSAGAVKYFDAALASSDYYGAEKGVWMGKGAQMLGLHGQVTRDDFVALVSNRKPDGTKLTLRTNKERWEKIRVWNEESEVFEEKDVEVPNRRAGYDICFSAPKSVSLVLGLTGDADIDRMFQESVFETMGSIESRMHTRVRGGGGSDHENRLTENCVYAAFSHHETRPINRKTDPHRHIHCYVPNATYDHVEGRWKACELSEVVADRVWYQAEVNSRFAQKLEAANIPIRRTKHGFELACVSPELIRKFSKRTQQIEEKGRADSRILNARARALMKESGLDYADAHAQIKSQLGAETREKKSTATLSPDEQKDDWRAQMTTQELACLTSETVHSGKSRDLIEPDHAKGMALFDLFDKRSVVRMTHAAAMLLRRGIGRVGIDEAREWARGGAFVKVNGHLVTTESVLRDERDMVARVRAGREMCEPLGRGGHWEIAEFLHDDQKAGVRHLLESRDLVTVIIGKAGSGKTTMALEAIRGIEALSGRRVVALAQSSAAAETLREGGIENAETLSNFQDKDFLEDLARGQVLLIDEAGLLCLKETRWALDFVEKNGCRLILIGDCSQHHGVQRGDALRLLLQKEAVRAVTLSEIFRQVDPEMRAAMYSLGEGDIEGGFDRLNDLGAILEISDPIRRLDALSDMHLKALQDGTSALIITPTHAEGHSVSEHVRQRMKEQGMITGQEYNVRRLQKLDLNEWEQRDPMNYEPGRIVVFHKAVRGGFKPGEQWEVAGRGPDGAVIVSRNGQEKELPLDKVNFELYGAAFTPVASGDQIRMTNNFQLRGERFINNELVRVVAIDAEKVVVRRKNGKEVVIPVGDGLHHIDQGVTVTSYSSQSKGPDQMLCSAPVVSFGAVDRQQFYVSASRGRQVIKFFTDSIVALREAALRIGDRLSPVELVADAQKEQGRGLEKELAGVDLHAGARKRTAAEIEATRQAEQQPPDQERGMSI